MRATSCMHRSRVPEPHTHTHRVVPKLQQEQKRIKHEHLQSSSNQDRETNTPYMHIEVVKDEALAHGQRLSSSRAQ